MNIGQPIAAEEQPVLDIRDEEDNLFTLVGIQRTLKVRRRLVFGTALAVVALVAMFVVLVTPLYSTTAVVMLDQRRNNVEDLTAVLSGLGSDPTTIQNQVQILTSLELANRVIDKLALADDPEFAPPKGWTASLRYLNPFNWFPGAQSALAMAEGQDLERSRITHKFLDRLSVDPIGLSTAINVTFKSQDRVKAQRIANAVADAYVEDQLNAKFDATQKATRWLTDRIQELSRKSQLADAAVQSYKAEHNITTNQNGSSIVNQQTSDLNAQLILARTSLAEKQAAYSSLVALARAGRADNSAAAMNSQVIASLRTQDAEITRQLADLSTRYLPGHPKILDLQAQKSNIETKIREEVQRIVDSARNDVAIASAHVGSLQSSLSGLEARGASENKAGVQLASLQSAATSAKTLYESFLSRLSETQNRQGIETPGARIISLAPIPESPSFPKKWLTIGVSIPAGLLLGLLLALASERLDTGFRTRQQVEGVLGLPVLASVPEVGASGDPSGLVIEKPMSAFAEAIRGLQLGLNLSNLDRQPKVILVTSSVPGEGKTTVAISLARLAARAGQKVLLMEGDLRRPSVGSRLIKSDTKVGLIEALTGSVRLEDCLVQDDKSQMLILPCLTPPVSPADVLNSQAMQQLVRTASQRFDLVVIDSSPVLPVNDTKILSRVADTILFAIRWEKTPREASANAIRSLSDVRALVSGVVLTRLDSDRYNYYNFGDQDYEQYNKYYAG